MEELDAIAKRRCLMILSVLSGERPVSEVIEELGLSRGTYYQLETRALMAMMSALVPGASTESTTAASPQRRIAELEKKVTQLEAQKRRTDRLLYLTRQLVGRGPVTTDRGRPKKTTARKRSAKAGPNASRSSTKRTSTTSSPATTITPEVSVSIPTPDGADAH
jgi:hypothetical protein